MRPIHRILVAIKNPGARSLPAVLKGAQLARAFGAALDLFHGIDVSVYADTLGAYERTRNESEDALRDQYLQRLERVAARVRLHGIAVSTAAEHDYPVCESIIRRADHIDADLIVAERHEGRHIAPSLLGLTDWELLRLSRLPVLLVGRSRPYCHPTVLAAVDPSHAFSKPAQLDEEILRVGSAVTEALRGKLHAVHAYVSMPVGAAAAAAMTGSSANQIEATVAAEARDRLNGVLRGTDIPPARRHLVGRHPIDAIQIAARQTRSDIVVMGAVSRSGLKRLFIGNTAESLLDRLPCDLLIVKPAQFVNHVSRTPRGTRLIVNPRFA